MKTQNERTPRNMLTPSEELAKIEVVKIMFDDPMRTWRLTRAEPMGAGRSVEGKGGPLLIVSNLGTELARADTWGELLAKLTVLP